MTEAEIELRQTCRVSPEQYEAWYLGRRVGYLRLRHGWFSVECPDAGGIEVFEARPLGDGCFYDHEREAYLWKAKVAIAVWLMSVEAYGSSWRPIAEAPRDGTRVDLWGTRFEGDEPRRYENCYYEREEWHWDDGSAPVCPTHFMPLPAGPTSAQQ